MIRYIYIYIYIIGLSHMEIYPNLWQFGMKATRPQPGEEVRRDLFESVWGKDFVDGHNLANLQALEEGYHSAIAFTSMWKTPKKSRT